MFTWISSFTLVLHDADENLLPMCYCQLICQQLREADQLTGYQTMVLSPCGFPSPVTRLGETEVVFPSNMIILGGWGVPHLMDAREMVLLMCGPAAIARI